LKFFITGGAGFIGEHLVRSLLTREHQITIFDNFLNSSEDMISHLLDKGVALVKGDITNFEEIAENIPGFDTVIHLASKISVKDSISNPEDTMRVNVEGTVNVLRACVKQKVKNLVVASSAAVYGDLTDPNLLLSEDSQTNPISPYGTSKLAMEQQIKKFSNDYDLNSVILRLFNVYGTGQSDEYAGVITRFAKNIKEEKPLVIYGDGLQTRDFVNIEDVTDSIFHTISRMEGRRGSIYNIASGKSVTIQYLAEVMNTVSGKNLDIQYTEPREGDIRYSQADISLARKELDYFPKVKELDYFPKVELKDGIKNLLGS